jgi:hypothetical protein
MNVELGHPIDQKSASTCVAAPDHKPLDYLFDACYKKIEFPSFQAIQTKEL